MNLVIPRLRANARSSTELHALDFYSTPREATLALMRAERLPGSIADPACGKGAILNVLRDEGDHIVFGSDIVHYGWPYTVIRDDLAEPIVMNGTGIVTNPPYRRALQFVQKALADRAIYSAFLMRLAFLESMARKSFFEVNPPTRVHVFSRRLPMRHCHAASGLRSRWRFGSQGDEENQLSRLPLSARDHPAGDLALSPVHTKPT